MEADKDILYNEVLDIIKNDIPEGGIISLRIIIDEYRKKYPRDKVTDKNISETLNLLCQNLGMYGKIAKSEYTSFYVKKFDINNSKKGIRNQFVENLNMNYSRVYNFIKNNFAPGDTINENTVWTKYQEDMNDNLDGKFDYYYERAMETLLRDGKIKIETYDSENMLNTSFIMQEVRQKETESKVKEH